MTIRPFENPYQQQTPVKNAIFDRIMPALSGNGWKVLCVAIRQTWGWVDNSSPTGRKETDRISYSQFMEKTGVGSRATIARAIAECLDAGYLVRHQVGRHQGTKRPLYTYALNVGYELASTETVPEPESAGTETVPAASTESVPVAGTETVLTKERKQKENNSTWSMIWSNALVDLKGQMTQDTYDRWLDGTLAVGIDDGELLVACASPQAVDWLDSRLRSTIERTVRSLNGGSLGVRFVVR